MTRYRGQMSADYPGAPITVTEALADGRHLRPPTWGIPSALIAIVGSMVLAFALSILVMSDAIALPVALLLGISLPWVVMAGYPLWVTARKGNGPRIDLGLRVSWSDVRWGVGAGVVGLILAGIAAIITMAVAGEFTSAAGEVGEILSGEGRWAVLLFALAAMVGAPIAEEIAFRGLLFGALRKRGWRPWPTIVVTGVLFSAFHLEPVRFFVLLPVGILYGWVRWRTGSTGAAIIAHMVNNTPAAIVLVAGLPVTP